MVTNQNETAKKNAQASAPDQMSAYRNATLITALNRANLALSECYHEANDRNEAKVANYINSAQDEIERAIKALGGKVL